MRKRTWRLRACATVALGAALTSGCFYATAENIQKSAPNTRPWFCNAWGNGTPLSGHGNGAHVNPLYAGKTKGQLSWDDCLKLGHELDDLLAATKGFETRGKAEKAGYYAAGEYIAGLGTHHVNPAAFSSFGSVDPKKPMMLIYGGYGPEAPLVGISYAVLNTPKPPPAFAGDNDWWHIHKSVCVGPNMRPIGDAEELSDAECKALGGTNRAISVGGAWLLHLWMIPDYEYKLDVFASGHPCLGPDGALPKSDPCWANLSFRDPTQGPAPGVSVPGHGH